MLTGQFTGTFTEAGIWYTDTGHRGPLESVVHITVDGDDLCLAYEDGTRHLARGAASGPGHFPLEGDGISGLLCIGAQTLLLDYTTQTGGRTEHNVDVWTFAEHGITRSGRIRQPERYIWFEAIMFRQPAGT